MNLNGNFILFMRRVLFFEMGRGKRPNREVKGKKNLVRTMIGFFFFFFLVIEMECILDLPKFLCLIILLIRKVHGS